MSDDKILEPGVRIKPEVTPGKAKEVVRDFYGLNCITIKELNGYDDINYYITVESIYDNKYIDKVCASGYVLKIINVLDSQKPQVFDAQTEVLLHLGKNQINCPKPVKNKNGEYNFVMDFPSGKHIVRLLEFIKGTILYEVECTNEVFYQVGQQAANLDNKLKNFDHPEFRSYKSIWLMSEVPQIKKFIFAVKDENRKKLVEEILEDFCCRVVPAIPNLEKGMIHGDLNEQNILVTKEDDKWLVNTILDFGDAHYGCYLFELAIAMTYMMLQGKSLDIPGYVLAGYSELRTIPDSEYGLLKICIAGRICQSLVMGAYSSLQDPGNDYILITSKTGWMLLEELWKQPEDSLLKQWKQISQTYKP